MPRFRLFALLLPLLLASGCDSSESDPLPDGGRQRDLGPNPRPDAAPTDCKTHTVLGSGWDFGGASYDTNMTMCGSDGYRVMLSGGPGGGAWVFHPSPGLAYAIWIR